MSEDVKHVSLSPEEVQKLTTQTIKKTAPNRLAVAKQSFSRVKPTMKKVFYREKNGVVVEEKDPMELVKGQIQNNPGFLEALREMLGLKKKEDKTDGD